MMVALDRIPGGGWIVLLGGGEFSFDETALADQAWLAKVPEGVVGFLPTASGSVDYARHFGEYLDETFQRQVKMLPIYRGRDARRSRNLERIGECAAVYIGGGLADQLLEVIAESPTAEALAGTLRRGGVVVAVAAAAQSLGRVARPLAGGGTIAGLAWLPHGVVETNFNPGHDRRLRSLMKSEGVRWGVGVPAGSALLLGPEGESEQVGEVFCLDDPDGDFRILE